MEIIKNKMEIEVTNKNSTHPVRILRQWLRWSIWTNQHPLKRLML